MKTVTLYINWKDGFVTANPSEAINAYLNSCNISIEEYAVGYEIVDHLEDNETLTDTQLDKCYNEILKDIDDGLYWEIREIEIT